MDYFQLNEFLGKAHPGKNISCEFDEKCIRQIELIYTDGKLHDINHVQYEQCRVCVEGQDPYYVPIMPHRQLLSSKYIQEKIPADVVHVTEVSK